MDFGMLKLLKANTKEYLYFCKGYQKLTCIIIKNRKKYTLINLFVCLYKYLKLDLYKNC